MSGSGMPKRSKVEQGVPMDDIGPKNFQSISAMGKHSGCAWISA